MKRVFIAALGLVLSLTAQQPVPATQMAQRNEIFRNAHVVAYRTELAPGEVAKLHTHQQATLNVVLTPARRRVTVPGKHPVVDYPKLGDVIFDPQGTVHSTQNIGNQPIRVTAIDFLKATGKAVRSKQKASRYCNAGSKTACVKELYLFCTGTFCAEDVTFGPGAISTKHAHMTDHMLIAISDYELKDEVEGKGTVKRTRKSGEVEYIPAGITHQLTNTGLQPARFIVVAFK
jgi:oxalate decarboxylase/phosphoglucose isomerase-like protein (cupin superfamily)